MTDEEMLALVSRAFASVERPEHFTHYTHCCECAEHDETLRSRDVDTLTFDDLGNGSWDPMAFVSPQGFAYFLPTLARLALSDPHPTWGWLGPQLCWYLELDGRRNRRWVYFTAEQRDAVRALLEHIFDTRMDLIRDYGCEHELLRTIAVWVDRGDSDEAQIAAGP